MDSRDVIACCQTVSEDIVDQEWEQFDCETCAYAEARSKVYPENDEAWAFMNACGGKLAMDWHLGGFLFAKWTEGWSLDDVLDLLRRAEIIAEELAPPKASE